MFSHGGRERGGDGLGYCARFRGLGVFYGEGGVAGVIFGGAPRLGSAIVCSGVLTDNARFWVIC